MSSFVLLLVASALAPAPPAGPPTTRPALRAGLATRPAAVSPEETLWREITAATTDPPLSTQPYADWCAAALRLREARVARLELYRTLYPGGTYRVAAVRLELATWQEIGALRGGDFSELCGRAERYLREVSPEDPVAAEAAYWRIFCRRLPEAGGPSTLPAPASVRGPDAALLAAYREYVAAYPHSPYVPRLADVLFTESQRSGDPAEQRELVALLEANFPEHAVTARLAGQWLRTQAVGQPFWLRFETPDAGVVDTRTLAGQPVLIVVWASDAASQRRLAEVREFVATVPGLRVVGVNLDERREEMAATARALAIDWPQFNDDLGPANRFAREWGVRAVPFVFVIDRAGKLAGATSADNWRELAHSAVQAATSQPR